MASKELEIGKLYWFQGDPADILYEIRSIKTGKKFLLEMVRPIEVVLQLANIEHTRGGYMSHVVYDADTFLYYLRKEIWIKINR